MEKPLWLKNRGYLHITNQLNLKEQQAKLIAIIRNKNYIAKHAFFPLIHAVINERRYKVIDKKNGKRGHSYQSDTGEFIRTIKHRPLHYASHLDAVIFGYYASVLQEKYEEKMLNIPALSECVTAYRKIAVEDSTKNKSTIHFARDTFSEIKRRQYEDCVVLKFDIKSFFSRIDHQKLKEVWCELLGVNMLPPDHYNVFKSATKFSYILKDDLRLPYQIGKKREGFDEKKLATLRKKGILAFFESPAEFRKIVKEGKIKIHKYPFRNSEGIPVGIPQGLPISAILANLYLFKFDCSILENVVKTYDAFYRRYSDDIIIICNKNNSSVIKGFVEQSILERKVVMSPEKTEIFRFGFTEKNVLTSFKVDGSNHLVGVPFTYLGFEFYGNKTLIKSANIAKFYRRMIRSVKSKVKRALYVSQQMPYPKIIVFRQQLYKSYTHYPLESTKIYTKRKLLVKDSRGDFFYKTIDQEKKYRSNYISYVKRASSIMDEQGIKNQIRSHRRIFNEALFKHLDKVRNI